MNANEFSPISKIHIMRVYAGMANPEDTLVYEKWEDELRNSLYRSRIRDTATEPPTMRDANERGFILAWCEDVSNNYNNKWSFQPYWYVMEETAKIFPKWTQLPEVK